MKIAKESVMEDAIKNTQAQIEELDKNPQMKENLRALAAKRIRQFLETSADVDYGAALTPRGDKMVFVNEAYENKSACWKTCFRAGKEATEAARAFASAWLAELERP